MAITVPDNPKVYTTKYDNFRGVDMTNDPSNVWYRRSPDGKNMLPDMDGRPYKRTGWDVEVRKYDFIGAAHSHGSPTPHRVYYFELGGYDYLVIFNSLGMFTLTDITNPNVPQSPVSTDNPWTVSDKYVLTYHPIFVDLDNAQISATEFDPNRAFFFEGGGEAGFYVFCKYEPSSGVIKQKLVRLTASSPLFHEVEPHIPNTLIMCDEYGVGEFLEPVNMLTPKRMISYANDKSGVTKFYLPTGESYLTVHKVEVRSANGDWTETSSYSLDTTDYRYIQFGSQPTHYVDGEDNIRVTYTPAGEAGQIATRAATAIQNKLSITVTEVWRQRCAAPGPGAVIEDTGIQSRTVDRPYVTFPVSNLVTGTSSFQKYSNGSWTSLPTTDYEADYNPYSTSVKIRATEAFLSAHEYTVLYETEWVRGKGQNGETRDYYYRSQGRKKITTANIRHNYTQWYIVSGNASQPEPRQAFWDCSKSMIFGNGLINQVFLGATGSKNYSTRVWYSGATDPTYFADDNYIEVGASDKPIMGFLKIGQYLGIIKGGVASDETIYLAYPTSFEDTTTFAVKQSIGGVGAVTKGAFNILNTEPLFLSSEGVMGVDETESDDRKVRNRSYYINKALCAESGLETAVSFVYDGMYWLSLNGHCYVLDGSQKNSWANEKTNLQYECYYLDNVPAQCFAKYNDSLWFADPYGALCRFKSQTEEGAYHDGYMTDPDWSSSELPRRRDVVDNCILVSELTALKGGTLPKVGDIVRYNTVIDTCFTVTYVNPQGVYIRVTPGVPINATWTTIADDDGAVHYFKSLQKKGCLVSLLPDQKNASGVDVYLRKDEQEPIYIGSTDEEGHWLPFEYYIKKKVKKYKRLQIICKNTKVDESFGIDEIIKMYTIGNFSKNKR